MVTDTDFILLLQEVPYHPHSYLEKLTKQFETISVVNVRRKDELRKYQKPPLFDERYLVLFDSLDLFDSNRPYLNFKTMFPVVHLESQSQLEDAEFLLKEVSLPYKIFRNLFTREDAYAMIQETASESVSDAVCKAIVRQVGLSPFRIITAVDVCEQMGFKVSVVERYVDKWIYPDVRKLIECLLGVPRSSAAISNSLVYLHANRYWYKYVRKRILEELDTILKVYRDKLSGKLASDQLFAYMEENQITRARVMYALRLYDRVSLVTVIALREFINSAKLIEVASRVSML